MFFLSVIRFCFNGFCVRQLDHFWGCEDNWSFKWQVDCVIFSISFMGILGWQFCNYFRLSWSRFVCSFFFDCWFCANKLDKSSRIGVNHEGHLWTTEIFDRLPSLCSYLNGFFNLEPWFVKRHPSSKVETTLISTNISGFSGPFFLFQINLLQFCWKNLILRKHLIIFIVLIRNPCQECIHMEFFLNFRQIFVTTKKILIKIEHFPLKIDFLV